MIAEFENYLDIVSWWRDYIDKISIKELLEMAFKDIANSMAIPKGLMVTPPIFIDYIDKVGP